MRRGAKEPAAAPLRFRRVLTPAERIEDWPRGEFKYLPVEPAEFDRLLSAAGRASGEARQESQARIAAAAYSARWAWFSGDRQRDVQNDAVRLDLLKATYRIERDSNSSLYAAADEVAAALGLNFPITFYQAQNAAGLNASLPYMPGEVHIVLAGPFCRC